MSNDPTPAPTQPKPQSQWAHVGDHYSQQRTAREVARAVAAHEGHGVAQWVWDRWTKEAREQALSEVRDQGLGQGRRALDHLLSATHAHLAQIAAAEAERIEREQQEQGEGA